jgi:hypothetical protein
MGEYLWKKLEIEAMAKLQMRELQQVLIDGKITAQCTRWLAARPLRASMNL